MPLPEHILTLLRRYRRTHRNERLIFRALGLGQTGAHTATEPMNRAAVQGAFRRALKAAGLARPHVSIHTLRHSYATHLLEAGVNIRFIQHALGLLHFRCSECGVAFELYRSCGNRHCPTCGKVKGKAWLDRRLDHLLPVPHFMITFTVPAGFRSLFLCHQRLCYTALFQASSSVLRRLAGQSTSFPGDTSGFFGVLHTWGRTLSYHPHIHYIVAAGAFDSRTDRRHPCPTAFYAPVRVLSKLVKARMFAALTRAALVHELPSDAFGKDWNVDSRLVGKGVRALRYLSAYVFRTAISDKRLLQITDRTVPFAYTDTTTGRHKQMTLSAEEFIRRFLHHVLPTGFMKIRYYGFLHLSSAIPPKLAVTLLEAFSDLRAPRHRKPATTGTAAPFCPACNATAVLLFYTESSRTPTGFT